jgi:hypothetical protein
MRLAIVLVSAFAAMVSAQETVEAFLAAAPPWYFLSPSFYPFFINA